MVSRKRIATRVAAVAPSLVHVYAPAGYGKSVLLRDLSRNGRYEDLPTLTDARTLGTLVRAWESLPSDGVLAIDRVDACTYESEAFAALYTALVQRGEGQRLIMASRVPLDFYERAVPPHEILTIGPDELRFTASEIAELFAAETGLDIGTLAGVATASDGWPAVVRFLARLHAENRLHAFFREGAHCRAARELYDYIEHAVIAQLPKNARRALSLCTSVNEFHVDDGKAVATAFQLGDAYPLLEELGLIRTRGPIVECVPVVRGASYSTNPGEREANAAALARALAQSGDRLRAAEIAADAGDEEAAAAFLQEAVVTEITEPLRVRSVTKAMSPFALSRHRNLWWKTIGRAVSPVFLPFDRRGHRASDIVTRALGDVGQARVTLAFTAALVAIYDDELILARRILEEIVEEGDPEPEIIAFAHVALAYVAVLEDRREDVDAAWERATAILPDAQVRFACEAFLTDLIGYTWSGRITYDWESILPRYDRVVQRGCATAIVRAAQAIANVGTLWSVEAMQQYGHREIRVLRGMLPEDTEAFLALYERGAVPPESGARLRVFNQLVAAKVQVRRGNIESARQLLEAAPAKAARSSEQFRCVVVEQLMTDLRALSEGTALSGLPESATTASAKIVLSRAILEHDNVAYELPERSLQLLLFIALRGGAARRAEIGEALWPVLNESGQFNALKSCVHRTRRAIPKHLLRSTREGYAIEGIEIDMLTAQLRVRHPHDIGNEELREVARVLDSQLPAFVESSECFQPFAARLALARERAWSAIGMRAIEGSDDALLHEIVGVLRERDAGSEEAASLLIQWHVRRGESARALEEYRSYRERFAQPQVEDRLAQFLKEVSA